MHSSPALCGKDQLWDALASLEELFKGNLEEDSVAALPFAQEQLLSWGCHARPSSELRCSCPARACAWPRTPLIQTETNVPVWPGNCLIVLILPCDHWRHLGYCLWATMTCWLVFPASPQSCLITRNLPDLFTEPCAISTFLWTSFLSPDLPCFGTTGWGPGWRVPCSAGLVSTLCPRLPSPEGQTSLAGADSDAGTGSTDRIPTK